MNTTITKKTKVKGSKTTQWNVTRDGVPFGAILLLSKGSLYNAQTLGGNSQSFDTLEGAKDFMTTTRWWDAA